MTGLRSWPCMRHNVFMRCGVLLFVLAAACSSPPPGHSHAGITGGTVDDGDPAVVAVQLSTGGSCSGTLISPRMVLTAEHCPIDPPAWGTVSFGTLVGAPTRIVKIVDTAVHSSADLRLLKLAHPVRDVAPIRVNNAPLGSSEIGRPLRHVGFGLDRFPNGGVADTKREATLTVRAIWGDDLVYSSDGGSGVCFGDSGGPGLMRLGTDPEEVLAGVASFLVSYPTCYGEASDVRVDPFAPWISDITALWEEETCAAGDGCKVECAPADPDCVCAFDSVCDLRCPRLSLDPDCPPDCGRDGICSGSKCPLPDPDCNQLGGVCTNDSECQTRTCATQAGKRFCSRGCVTAQDCPWNFYCSTTNRICLFKPKLGEECDALLQCTEGVCVSEPTGGKRCRSTCRSSAECLATELCLAESDTPGICRLKPVAPPPVQRQGCASGPGEIAGWMVLLYGSKRVRQRPVG